MTVALGGNQSFFDKVIQDINMRDAVRCFLEHISDLYPCYYDVTKILKRENDSEILKASLLESNPFYYSKTLEFLGKNEYSETAINNPEKNLNFKTSELVVNYIVVARLNNNEQSIINFFNNIIIWFNANTGKNLVLDSSGFIIESYSVKITVIDSLPDFANYIINLADEQKKIWIKSKNYYRGHSTTKYELIPAVFREEKYKKAEDRLYHEIILRNPNEFKDCSTMIEKMVIMQHFGLNTRLLDITSNPMIALYFACCSKQDENGEVIILNIDESDEKFYDDKEILALTSIAELDNDHKELFFNHPEKIKERQKILETIREKLNLDIESAEWKNIENNIGKKSYFVKTLLNNSRISAQNGSVIICADAIRDRKHSLAVFRSQELGDTFNICIIAKEAKKKILQQLDTIGINEASVFPDFAHAAQYIARTISEHQKEIDDEFNELVGD